MRAYMVVANFEQLAGPKQAKAVDHDLKRENVARDRFYDTRGLRGHRLGNTLDKIAARFILQVHE